jgi:hypothetical protein
MSAKDELTKRDSLFRGLGVKDGLMAVGWGKCEGTFEHPAYTRMTVSIAQRSGEERKEPYLFVMLSARNWNFLMRLIHIHDEISMADIIEAYPVSEANVADARVVQTRSNGHMRSLGLELELPWLRKPPRVGWMNEMPLRRA